MIMKEFKTVRGAFNYIKKNSAPNREKSLNKMNYFGKGIYTFGECINYSGIKKYEGEKFSYYFENDGEIIAFIEWLKKEDGHLIVEKF